MIDNETVLGRRGGKRPQKLDPFIAALLGRSSVEAAAQAAGVSRATGWRSIKDPVVIQRLREARRGAMKRAIIRLREAASEPVDCL